MSKCNYLLMLNTNIFSRQQKNGNGPILEGSLYVLWLCGQIRLVWTFTRQLMEINESNSL